VPSVNQQSLREEFDTLKARFEQQCTAGCMRPDNRALFQSLLLLMELLIAVLMEKRTPKTPTNSSQPSSQAPDVDTARHSGRHSTGKPLDKTRCANTRTHETVETVTLDACAYCGEPLDDSACQGHERRTQIDIIFEKRVRHVDAEIKTCSRCHKPAHASFPAGLAGPLQYGAGIKAYALQLLMAQMVSLKRIQQSIETRIGQTLAEATILKFVLQS
jgi:hypothetical protein